MGTSTVYLSASRRKQIMKRIIFSFIAICLLFTGYAQTESKSETNVTLETVVESYKDFGIGEDAIKNMRTYS